MKIIAHRINTIDELRSLPPEYGVEIDVRAYEEELILSHDPYQNGERLSAYLDEVGDRFVIFNVKESGIEDEVVELATEHGVTEYFLLDVEFPYIYEASRDGNVRNVAVRFSEAEPLEAALVNAPFVDWVWVDTITQFPLTTDVYRQLSDAGYKICLVSPDRWGRPGDIDEYLSTVAENDMELDAVMTSVSNAPRWQQRRP